MSLYYDAFQDSLLTEDTYGVSKITTAGTATYLIGAVSQRAKHPQAQFKARYAPVSVGAREVDAGGVEKADPVRNGLWTFVIQNGWPLWFAMGKSSTAGSSPYVHTLTPDVLPSFTIQHERTGTAPDDAKQYTGCLCGNLKVLWDDKVPSLTGVMDWVSQNQVDPNLDGTNAMLSIAPVLPTTTTQAPYTSMVTATFDGNDIDNIASFELGINPGLSALTARWLEGGVDMSHVPLAYMEELRRAYSLNLMLNPSSDDLWDEGSAISNTKDMVFKFQKDSDDYIEFTCSAVQVLYPETITPDQSRGEKLLELYEIEFPRLSIEVADEIAGGFYGE